MDQVAISASIPSPSLLANFHRQEDRMGQILDYPSPCWPKINYVRWAVFFQSLLWIKWPFLLASPPPAGQNQLCKGSVFFQSLLVPFSPCLSETYTLLLVSDSILPDV